jgi:4-amino-4-deoxy-L-arabinose transferase-like glycosyltransferase
MLRTANQPAAPAPAWTVPIWLEIVLLLSLLAGALFLRLWQLTAVPPGFHFDEAIDLRQALNIVQGARPLYITEGWGREALYYYLVALVLQIVPYNPLALRVSAVICGMGLLVVTYWFVRRWYGRLPAWISVAWLSLLYWPLSASRFGVRHISLPFVFGLAVWAFWWAWGDDVTRPISRPRFALAGFLLGLTLYTYQPARFVPFIFVPFFAYLWLFHRAALRRRLTALALWVGTALLVMLPLIVILLQNRGLESGERAFTIEPLTQLLDGNPQPVRQNLLATAKVFTISGDPLESYNVPDRPIFVPAWTGLFFYAGLLIALWRWRQPLPMFLLLWLLVMLAPTVLTLSAPNFNRMVAAQTPMAIIAALPFVELAKLRLPKTAHRAPFTDYGLTAVPLLILLLALGFTTVATWEDYFTTWPNHPGTVAPLGRNVAAIAHYLEFDASSAPAVISSANLEDAAPYVVDVSLDRDDFPIRWVDSGQAMVLPAGVANGRLIVAADRWIDDDIRAFWHIPNEPITQTAEFAVYTFQQPDFALAAAPFWAIAPGAPWNGEEGEPPLQASFPALFQGEGNGRLTLQTITLTRETAQAGATLTALSIWQVETDGEPASLAIFAHLLDASGQIVAQQDGLGYPPHTWRVGDIFTQVHHLALDGSLPPGRYWLQLGLYRRETGSRWLVLDATGAALADRILIPVEVSAAP